MSITDELVHRLLRLEDRIRELEGRERPKYPLALSYLPVATSGEVNAAELVAANDWRVNSVVMRAYAEATATSFIGGGTAVPINYHVIVNDDEAAVSYPSGVMRYTAPISAWYHINASTLVPSALATDGSLFLEVAYNGARAYMIDVAAPVPIGGGNYGHSASGSIALYIASGAYIQIRGLLVGTAATRSTYATAGDGRFYNWLHVARF